MPDKHSFESINPACGERIARTPAFDSRQLEQALARAEQTAAGWRGSGFDERGALLSAVADQLHSQRESLAGLIIAEMGKLRAEALAEVDKCAWVCRYYAEHGAAFLADQDIPSDAAHSFVTYQPLGLVLAVMPWNFPFWQVFRFAAPAVMAGNAGLLKHAANVMQCSAAIAQLFTDAGAPPGLFSHLPIASGQVGEVIADPRVRAVTLTGSGAAGSAVAAQAGKALKKSVLELGGSDPFIVLEDADIELAVRKGVQSRFMNAGQSCIAAKRFIVVESVADEFEHAFTEAVAALLPGDPADPGSTLAPMARDDLRSAIDAQVRDALDQGARLLTGGAAIEGPGFYYQPTLLADIRPGMRAYSEELFGPAASILRVRDTRQALEQANATEFGLGGSVWTRDRERGLAVARDLECGCVFINELVKSDPRLPFGGVKASGFGRELAQQGIREFVNAKTVWVD